MAAGDCPESAGALLQQMPLANANALRLLMQTCCYMNEQAALNEMDSQALSEVGVKMSYCCHAAWHSASIACALAVQMFRKVSGVAISLVPAMFTPERLQPLDNPAADA